MSGDFDEGLTPYVSLSLEDGGFAMIPNDTRATEIYAYSDKGSLQLG